MKALFCKENDWGDVLIHVNFMIFIKEISPKQNFCSSLCAPEGHKKRPRFEAGIVAAGESGLWQGNLKNCPVFQVTLKRPL